MASKTNDKTNMTIGVIVIAIIAIGVGAAIRSGQQNNISDGNSQENTGVTKTDDEYTDAMKKCTVMEGVDIYRTGVGGNRNTAFEDAQKTCLSWYQQWGEKDFYDAVNEDWENRKSEVVDGHNLEYYLSILGW